MDTWRRHGANILPRDIFDIAAASLDHRQMLVAELSNHKSKVARALAQIEAGERGYVDSAIADLPIRPSFDGLKKDAVGIATELLREAVTRPTPASET
ncbi:hypothetical protein IHQ71_03650 [Rhizobium sp. TH2]|uniref:hypothetical protein n=1 Tax=Rhizobium sp. TH2 TaxID=2775403 RepID=UPI002157D913|nr:hypothetical protein [Rhizobium sp. TH2]UVC09723.1 hypothetical protein IHQ71_03650 [Rhizobium sp. TH2]